ncbi:hypothetical protein GE09DRAFT_542381 [Coniochaeta sp. 2T2.1]|nr:hypothetical protein GE09DRAFT_542381 [Coniochaeta sp. 2T2.1]
MLSKTVVLSALLALSEARFGREGFVQDQIQKLSNFGVPGEAGTLAGQTPGVLLAGANACAKLQLADKIVETLGDDPAVIAGAAALVAAEKNVNPFVSAIPAICSEKSLPATEALRGIVALVDPDTLGSDVENANSATSLVTPFDARGLSVAEVMAANGFTNFTTQGLDGAAGAAPAAGNGNGAGAGNNNGNGNDAAATTSAADATATADCPPAATVTKTVAASAVATTTAEAEAPAATTPAAGAGDGVQGSTIAGLDFGLCQPTLKFVAGLNGRKATEFTFQAIDPLVSKGQQEALNPKIIMNRICDQLTNVCEANDAAKAACKQALADLGDGPRDVTTADAWNTALGFEGTDTN